MQMGITEDEQESAGGRARQYGETSELFNELKMETGDMQRKNARKAHA
jgi:hypothetical protein